MIKKKSILLVLVAVLAIALLAGCGLFRPKRQEDQTTEEKTTKQVETTTKEDVEKSGRLDDVYFIGGYAFPVSSKWEKEDEIMDNTMYFYAEDSMTFVMFQLSDGNFPIENETFQDQFVEGFSSGIENAEIISKETATLKNGIQAFHLVIDGKSAGMQMRANIYCLNGSEDQFLTVGIASMNENQEMLDDFDEMMNTFCPEDEWKGIEQSGGDKDPVKDLNKEKIAAGTVLLDDSFVLVTFKEFKNGTFGPEIKLEVQNKYDKPILVQCDEVNIDGYEVDALMSTSLQPGKKSVESISFFSEDLEDIGVTDLTDCSELSATFRVMDDDSWDELNEIEVTFFTDAF